MNQHYAKADLVLLCVTLLAAAGWIFSKEALLGMAPLLFVGIRFSCAGLLLLGSNLQRSRQLWCSPQLKKSLLTGLVMAGALLCWIQGLALGRHLGIGAFLTSLGILLVPLLSCLLFKEQVARSTWVALPVAACGLYLLSVDGGLSADPGQLWYLAAAILFGLHFTLISRLSLKVPAAVLSGVQLFIVGITGLLASLLTESWQAEIPIQIWGWLLASILLATSLRFTLQTYGQSLAPASHAALILILEPVWTALAAAFWFSETMHLSELFGCILIFSALLVSRWRWVAKIFSRT